MATRYLRSPSAPSTPGSTSSSGCTARIAVGQRHDAVERLVAHVGQPGAHARTVVGDAAELGLGRVGPAADAVQVGQEALERRQVDVAVVEERRALPRQLRPGVDADLRDGGEVVEGVAQAAYVAHGSADDGQDAPHVAAEALHRPLDVVHVVAGAGGVLRGRRDVAVLQGRPGGVEIGSGGLRRSGCAEEREGEQPEAEEQEGARGGRRDGAEPAW